MHGTSPLLFGARRHREAQSTIFQNPLASIHDGAVRADAPSP